jgi:hypothetical protein
VARFIAWVQAKEQGQVSLADILRARFRAERRTPFEDWLASGPPRAASRRAPRSTSHLRPGRADGRRRRPRPADAALDEAQKDNQISDNFVLTAVLFASVLLAGTAAKPRPQSIRWTTSRSLFYLPGRPGRRVQPSRTGFEAP